MDIFGKLVISQKAGNPIILMFTAYIAGSLRIFILQNVVPDILIHSAMQVCALACGVVTFELSDTQRLDRVYLLIEAWFKRTFIDIS